MSYARVIGFVPHELRDTLVRPLPESLTTASGSRELHRAWLDALTPFESGLGTDYDALFRTVAGLGRISCRWNTYVEFSLVQAPASVIGEHLGWHKDGYPPPYHRLVTCDVFGTQYRTLAGDKPTPGFGILSFDGQVMHAPQLGPASVLKTRLQVTEKLRPGLKDHSEQLAQNIFPSNIKLLDNSEQYFPNKHR